MNKCICCNTTLLKYNNVGEFCPICSSVFATNIPTDEELTEYYKFFNEDYHGGGRTLGSEKRQAHYAEKYLKVVENFSSEKFDLIYCYHVLEHVNDPEKVLLELKRVLSKSGILFIGFPNRRKILPRYISSHLNISWLEIIKFNFYDYKMRLRGKFKNEFGAHAGFTEKEFLTMTNPIFSNTSSIRKELVEKNYPKFTFLLKLIDKLNIANLFYPSNYFIIEK